MRRFMIVLLVVAVAASAGVRTGGTGMSNPWACDGTYTVDDIFADGLARAYGLAIKDNDTNSIWILNWGDMVNYEYDMVGGAPTGNTFAVANTIDPDDLAYCEYTTGNQWFMSHYVASWFSVYEEDGTWLRDIDGPAAWAKIMGMGAGHDMVYVGADGELAWGAYTGTETTTTWSTMAYESIYGIAVWGDYLFVSCAIIGADNVFIHSIATDGTPSASPIWSCNFIESESGSVDGGIDYDGTNLWLYPQNNFLFKLTIDFDPSALESDTWAGVKSSF